MSAFSDNSISNNIDLQKKSVESENDTASPSAPFGPSINQQPRTLPIASPSIGPSATPKIGPSIGPSATPKIGPSIGPSTAPKIGPSIGPSTAGPKIGPSIGPSATPKIGPSIGPSAAPKIGPSSTPLNPPGHAYSAANIYGQPFQPAPPVSNTYNIRPIGGNPAFSSAQRQIKYAELRNHNNANSLWIGYKGCVYDATDYKHSGGLAALLRGSGKDATKMITIQHSWVKVDEILGSKKIGVLVDEPVESDGDDSD